MPRATAAPPATASEPPSQKSFCTSTMMSARTVSTVSCQCDDAGSRLLEPLPADRYYKLVRGHGSSGAPVMAPGMTWAQARATAERVLPGVRYRRHLLWRYSLRWDKPGG